MIEAHSDTMPKPKHALELERISTPEKESNKREQSLSATDPLKEETVTNEEEGVSSLEEDECNEHSCVSRAR